MLLTHAPILFGSIIAHDLEGGKQVVVARVCCGEEGRVRQASAWVEGRVGAAANAVAIVSAGIAR